MPRLVHRTQLYRRHKSTNQAVVSLFGHKVYLGPCGSPRSHEHCQQALKKWEQQRHKEANAKTDDDLPPVGTANRAKPTITAAQLRAKRLLSQPIAESKHSKLRRAPSFARRIAIVVLPDE